MRWLLRIVLILLSLPIAYFAGWYAERFTVAPLGHGLMEGTPLTEPVFFLASGLTIIVIALVGNKILSVLNPRQRP